MFFLGGKLAFLTEEEEDGEDRLKNEQRSLDCRVLTLPAAIAET